MLCVTPRSPCQDQSPSSISYLAVLLAGGWQLSPSPGHALCLRELPHQRFHPLLRGSPIQWPVCVWGYQSSVLNLGRKHLWRAIPASVLPVWSAEASVVAASPSAQPCIPHSLIGVCPRAPSRQTFCMEISQFITPRFLPATADVTKTAKG